MSDRTIAAGYTAIADAYDEQLKESAWVREQLWRRYLSVFRAGDHVLDVGCGTGIDDVFLATHGIHVTAIDISEGMIARLRKKVHDHHLDRMVEAHVMDIQDMSVLADSAFDGIISAFAALNTLRDIQPFVREAARVIKPGGQALVHLANRESIWNTLGSVARSRAQVAAQESRTDCAVRIGNADVPHFTRPSSDLIGSFSERFVVTRVYGYCFMLPFGIMRRLPRAVQRIVGIAERFLGRVPPFSRGAYFIVLELTRRAEQVN